MERVSATFGVPPAPEKTEGPTTSIKFLGILIDVSIHGLFGSTLCPVQRFLDYSSLRPEGPSLLLIHADGCFLSEFHLVQVFHQCLARLRIEAKEYSSHSSRIGLATEAARWGLGSEAVWRIGRLESDRYRLYVHPHLLSWFGVCCSAGFWWLVISVVRSSILSCRRWSVSSLDLHPFLCLLGWIVSRSPFSRPAIEFFKCPGLVVGDSWPQMVPFLPELQFYVGFDRAPDVLVIHAGGNYLSVRTTREILRDIKLDCLHLWTSYPGIVLVRSDIVARRVWRQARSLNGLNKTQAKLNKTVGRFVTRTGGIVVRHRELEAVDDSLLRPDGVHLNAIGLDIWILSL